ncbi:hypothetical protein ACN27F_07575 [Solwaraspora sp. WMMB335]|uniref:hypothetical protein n=1 Tax=Solwaraspora sp. WMMB335 TaxID=3404118 RepID=UPI003B960BDD
MYFSDYFGIENPDQHDWFDPTLERDTLLFVDPFLLFSDTEEKWRTSHDRLIGHFQNAFELLAQTGMNRQHQYYKRVLILMESKEPKEFRLGFATKKGVDGSGSGKWLASQVVEAMGEAIKRGLSEIEHFEELGILVEGIDKDRISDLTCNLLKPEFIEYTQHICHSLGIEMHEVEVSHSKFDEGRRRWTSSTHLLPTDQKNKAIILVPKRFLRELPTLNGWDWVDEDSIRDDLNIDIARNIKKSDIVALARQILRHYALGSEARHLPQSPIRTTFCVTQSCSSNGDEPPPRLWPPSRSPASHQSVPRTTSLSSFGSESRSSVIGRKKKVDGESFGKTQPM